MQKSTVETPKHFKKMKMSLKSRTQNSSGFADPEDWKSHQSTDAGRLKMISSRLQKQCSPRVQNATNFSRQVD